MLRLMNELVTDNLRPLTFTGDLNGDPGGNSKRKLRSMMVSISLCFIGRVCPKGNPFNFVGLTVLKFFRNICKCKSTEVKNEEL